MFSRFLFLTTAFAVTLQVTFSLDNEEVNRVITHCQNKVKRIQATEGNYVQGQQNRAEPSLVGIPFVELLRIVYGIQQKQTVFECISDKLNGYTDEDLEKYDSYLSLKEKCTSERPEIPQCDPLYPYRSFDGTCNNIDYPRWGSTLYCFLRLFPANYEGVSGLRLSVDGKRRLPKPRTVSLNLVKPKSRPTRNYNALFVFFGQAIAHDLAQLIPAQIVEGGQGLDCCRYARTKYQYPECVPILLPTDDPYYSRQNVSCLSVPRSAVCDTCSVEKRIQISQVTAYIDCSIVYGQTDYRANLLRRYDGTGKLTTQQTEAGELLPPAKEEGSACSRQEEGAREKDQYCFQGGDTRVNQHALLAMFHTLLLREHNRLAEKLKILNPHWGEEKLYQEARKILIAEFQIIIYKEYLPLLIGNTLMTKYELDIECESSYDPTLDPSISIEFNAAAFRVHSLIPGKVVDDEDYEYLRNLFSNDVPLYDGRTGPFLSKMSYHRGEKYDSFMPLDITFYLYKVEFGTFGFDLASLDIQRGRDVGLPTYSQVIEYMENRPGTIKNFEDLEQYLVPKCLRLLEKTYSDVRDIDLWMGLNCERVPQDMIISPTAAEIIAEQFYRAKHGDRFFVEHDHTLTHAQRQTLLNASLAKLICDNTNVPAIQPDVMLFPSVENVPQACSTIPGVDLENWKDEDKRF